MAKRETIDIHKGVLQKPQYHHRTDKAAWQIEVLHVRKGEWMFKRDYGDKKGILSFRPDHRTSTSADWFIHSFSLKL